MSEVRADQTEYKVVVNKDGMYSIWPADRENLAGWKDAGKTGTKHECLVYIENIWPASREV